MHLFDWSSLDALVPRAEGISLVATTTPRVSRLGGAPEFVDEWPQGEHGPLPFICQLDLGELSAESRGHWPGDFPKEGVLSIFFNEDESPTGDPSLDCRNWAALFDEGRTRRVATHGPGKDRYSSMWVEVATHTSDESPQHRLSGMPDWIQYSETISRSHFLSGDYLRYGEAVQALKEAGAPKDAFVRDIPRLIKAGHQLDKAGIEPSRLGQGLKNWGLLLQIDWEPRIGLSLVDAGRLFIFGDRNTLRQGSQPSTWFELEYH